MRLTKGRHLGPVAEPDPEPPHAVFCSGAGCLGPDSCRSSVLHEVEAADGSTVQILATRTDGVPMVVVGSLVFPFTSAIDLEFALEKAIQSVRLDIYDTTGEVPPNSWWRS